jgi:hypothetical protein
MVIADVGYRIIGARIGLGPALQCCCHQHK